ncbi:hypothetical protein M758_10G081000 [Ceratodon purpureus]|nr:hypothetical protein KC19_10G082300 [Ceratodon purpureus]KAG0559139.1 hypothetical protein KC19_10G082300 [Ceratodon purpureus]KAG0603271.1 hypothetical protein M758_10G081000 [Ceratodon purpureus]KAG0603276.1 hypothetical protein M758_10G081000 [Ceratodon purpureus]
MEDFPALEPVPVQALSMEERMTNMEKKAKETEEKFEKKFVRQGQLLLPFCERELVILGAEILKWSVKKQGVEDGHGLHLFDSDVKSEVFLGCRAYSGKSKPAYKDLVAYKEMSKSVITLRNSTAHYRNIEALEAMVDMAVAAIAEWPQLVTKYPAQVQIVRRYKTFKQLLPHSFPSSQ